jgi:hypothetical protein
MVHVNGKYMSKDDYYNESFEKIEECLSTLGMKPYSGTIIGIRLCAVAEKCGTSTANKLIDDLDLEAYGYKKVTNCE